MYKVHDKVSWLADGQRYYGFIHALVNRGAYVTAIIERYKTHVEVPLEQLTIEPTYGKEKYEPRRFGFQQDRTNIERDWQKVNNDMKRSFQRQLRHFHSEHQAIKAEHERMHGKGG